MHGISNDQWPNSLQVLRFTPDNPPSYHKGNRDLYTLGLQNIISQLVGSTFLRYYEKKSDVFKSAIGSDPKKWPPLWRFAWLIRNAVAHSDKFCINDPNFPLTSWRGITVTQSMSGRRWFDLDGGFLAGGDILELMEELHTQVL